MKLLIIAPGTALLTLLEIEAHFQQCTEPIQVKMISPLGEEGILEVTGLPYFDERGNVELPFKVVKAAEEHIAYVMREMEVLNLKDCIYYMPKGERVYNGRYKPISKPNKKVNKIVSRTRSSCR